VAEQYRIGLIVPSSNTTMETEIPAMLARRVAEHDGQRFTFHSSRVRLQQVTAEALAAMVDGSERCVVELADAHVDVMAYACLVAVMAQGSNYHEQIEPRLAAVAAASGPSVPVISSAGALVRGLQALRVSRVAIVAPYLARLTELVVNYLRDAGIEVVDSVSLEIPDNIAVGQVDPLRLPEIAERLDLSGAECLVLSACVQMPSLPAIEAAEQRFGLPVVSASVATTYEILARLDLDPVVPGAGRLLAGQLPVAAAPL